MKNRILISEIIWVACGGALGALMRHGTNQIVPHLVDGHFLLTATSIENILGCFLIGILYTLLRRRADKNRNLTLFLLTGVIGSYTTYSGFMIEAFGLFRESVYLFLIYQFSQIFVGVLAVWAGKTITENQLNKR